MHIGFSSSRDRLPISSIFSPRAIRRIEKGREGTGMISHERNLQETDPGSGSIGVKRSHCIWTTLAGEYTGESECPSASAASASLLLSSSALVYDVPF